MKLLNLYLTSACLHILERNPLATQTSIQNILPGQKGTYPPVHYDCTENVLLTSYEIKTGIDGPYTEHPSSACGYT